MRIFRLRLRLILYARTVRYQSIRVRRYVKKSVFDKPRRQHIHSGTTSVPILKLSWRLPVFTHFELCHYPSLHNRDIRTRPSLRTL